MAELSPYIAPPPSMKEFTTPGTHSFKVPSKVLRVLVQVIGGGGGGGPSHHGVGIRGKGGGAGGALFMMLQVTPGDTITIVVGSGGARGWYDYSANTAHNAGTGGTSSITYKGVTYRAYGGKGGTFDSHNHVTNPGAGGSVNAYNIIHKSNGASATSYNGAASLAAPGGIGSEYGNGTDGSEGSGGGGAGKNPSNDGIDHYGGYGGAGKVVIMW